VTDLPELHRGGDAFALSFWFLATSVENRGDLFTYKGAGGELSIQFGSQGGGTLAVVHNRLLGSAAGILANQWYHLALTRDSLGELALYLNGQLAFSLEDAESLDIHSDPLIGANHNGDPSASTQAFSGRIDEFAFWNRSLSRPEILEFNAVGRSKPISYGSILKTDIGTQMANRNSSVYLRIPLL
jgi:Concanavalin A-like lectin/glucanases superfamily